MPSYPRVNGAPCYEVCTVYFVLRRQQQQSAPLLIGVTAYFGLAKMGNAMEQIENGRRVDEWPCGQPYQTPWMWFFFFFTEDCAAQKYLQAKKCLPTLS
jgi:hypothetical protein